MRHASMNKFLSTADMKHMQCDDTVTYQQPRKGKCHSGSLREGRETDAAEETHPVEHMDGDLEFTDLQQPVRLEAVPQACLLSRLQVHVAPLHAAQGNLK